MERPGLRSQILEATFLWLVANLISLALLFFFGHRSDAGGAFSLAVANLNAACIIVPPRAFRRFKKWQQVLLCFSASFIIVLPGLLLALFKLSVLQTPLFQGGWLILTGLLIYMYLTMIALLTLSYQWLTREQANQQIQDVF